MKVVVIASEALPFAQTGGLADVAAALPPALERLGIAVSLMIPCYRSAWTAGPPLHATGVTVRVPVGAQVIEGQVQRTTLPHSTVPVYLIDQPDFFDRNGLYQDQGVDFPDNAERYIFFARAVLEAIRLLDLRPDVVHGNDWQTGLVPVYLAERYRTRPGFETVGTLHTIHNLAYQGYFPPEDLALTGLDRRLFNWRELEFYGGLDFLKAGLVFADRISTVSPTYAREIQTPEFGHGLDGLLRHRAADLRGIVNGIDHAVWDPSTDPHLATTYDAANVVTGKAACKGDLQRAVGLPERPEIPLFAQIGRLVPQKGWDMLAEVADDLLRDDVQLVVLGQGEPHYHDLLSHLRARHPNKVRDILGFSIPLAHRIEAGADLFLMPSLFEPCGLSQLYSLAYGTVPIVRATGGLAETVVDATPPNLARGEATGFTFREPTPGALREAIGRALTLWPDRTAWLNLVRAGMRADWSWDRSARAYALLYDEIQHLRTSRAAG